MRWVKFGLVVCCISRSKGLNRKTSFGGSLLKKTGILEFSGSKWHKSLINQILARFQFSERYMEFLEFCSKTLEFFGILQDFILCFAYTIFLCSGGDLVRFQNSKTLFQNSNSLGITLESWNFTTP